MKAARKARAARTAKAASPSSITTPSPSDAELADLSIPCDDSPGGIMLATLAKECAGWRARHVRERMPSGGADEASVAFVTRAVDRVIRLEQQTELAVLLEWINDQFTSDEKAAAVKAIAVAAPLVTLEKLVAMSAAINGYEDAADLPWEAEGSLIRLGVSPAEAKRVVMEAQVRTTRE